jgi:hypothetical protein
LGGAEQLHYLQSSLMRVTGLLTQNIFELGLPRIWQNVGTRSPGTQLSPRGSYKPCVILALG